MWSYSNAGAANVLDVIDLVLERRDCAIESYSAAHRHHQHGRGGGGSRPVKEYLVVFTPDKKLS
jgi:hypothetical protein